MEKFKVASTMSSRQILKTLGLYQDLCDVMTDDEVDFTVEISCNSIDNICKLINAMNGHKLSYNSQIDKDNIIVNLLNDCFSDIIEKIRLKKFWHFAHILKISNCQNMILIS